MQAMQKHPDMVAADKKAEATNAFQTLTDAYQVCLWEDPDCSLPYLMAGHVPRRCNIDALFVLNARQFSITYSDGHLHVIFLSIPVNGCLCKILTLIGPRVRFRKCSLTMQTFGRTQVLRDPKKRKQYDMGMI